MRGMDRLKRLARKVSPFPPAVVLAYHRVTDAKPDPQKLCVSPANFSAQLEVLRSGFLPLSLREFSKRLGLNRWSPRTVVLTFDDGYADNLHFAKPLLERADIPATVFVTSGMVGSGREFWWDALEGLFLSDLPLPVGLELRIGEQDYRWSDPGVNNAALDEDWNVLATSKPTPRQQLYLDLSRLIRPLDPDRRDALIADLHAWAGREPGGRKSNLALDPSELRELAKGGLVEVGAHTVRHPVLSAVPAAVQQREIAHSKQALEDHLAAPVTSFAYPFGGRDDYAPQTVELVRNAGYSCACSNFQGQVNLFTDPYQIPRFLVRDWDGDEFSQRLEAWFAR